MAVKGHASRKNVGPADPGHANITEPARKGQRNGNFYGETETDIRAVTKPKGRGSRRSATARRNLRDPRREGRVHHGDRRGRPQKRQNARLKSKHLGNARRASHPPPMKRAARPEHPASGLVNHPDAFTLRSSCRQRTGNAASRRMGSSSWRPRSRSGSGREETATGSTRLPSAEV
jgi:hypothetical protein